MSHARLKLDTCKIHSDATCGTTTKIFYTDWEVKEPINISYFSVLWHKQWSYWLKHWSTTLSFFHSKTFPSCALRSMMKNICRVCKNSNVRNVKYTDEVCNRRREWISWKGNNNCLQLYTLHAEFLFLLYFSYLYRLHEWIYIHIF